MTRLGTWFLPTLGDGDSMTDRLTQDNYDKKPVGFPPDTERMLETWYVPAQNIQGTAPLYRLYSGQTQDHMDSELTGGAFGYTVDHVLGYPWTTQVPATKPITRYLDAAHFDHRTWLNSAPPNRSGFNYGVDLVFNSANGIPRYGYERFGQQMQRCGTLDPSVESVTYQQSIANSLIRIDFNKPWGNAIGRLTYKNVRQIVQNEDIGSMIQGNLQINIGQPVGCCLLSPQESGSQDGGEDYGVTEAWAGSPILSTSPGSPTTTLETTTRPLNAYNYAFVGQTDRLAILAWNGTFFRKTTVGYDDGPTHYENVVPLRFGAQLGDPAMLALQSYSFAGMHLSSFIRLRAWANWDSVQYEAWDPVNETATPVTQPNYAEEGYLCLGDVAPDETKPLLLYHGECHPGQALIAYDGEFAVGLMPKDKPWDTGHALSMSIGCDQPDANPTVCHGERSWNVGLIKNRRLNASRMTFHDGYIVLGDSKEEVEARLHAIYRNDNLPDGDTDGNGAADIVWRNANGATYLWLMSNGNLSSAVPLPTVTGWEVVANGDFNGDRRSDLLWRDAAGTNVVWFMNGATITAQATLPNADPSWSVVGSGDVDGDGRDDLLWRQQGSAATYVWFMHGSTATTSPLPDADPSWRVMGVRDLNADGRADLVWRRTDGANYVWLMDGANVTAIGLPTVDTSWDIAAVADFSRDGKGDIFWRRDDGTNYVWIMDGATIAAQSVLASVAPGTYDVVAWGDFNNDAREDLLWRNAQTGTNVVWLMNGTTVTGAPTITGADPIWRVVAPK